MNDKYKAWDKKDKKWVDEFAILPDETLFYPWDTEVELYEYLNCILLKSTGLKDIDGKDIYGDCDLLTDPTNHDSCIFMLKWIQEDAGYRLYFWLDGDNWDWDESIDDFYDYEKSILKLQIIGNRFENPDLIDDKNYDSEGRRIK